MFLVGWTGRQEISGDILSRVGDELSVTVAANCHRDSSVFCTLFVYCIALFCIATRQLLFCRPSEQQFEHLSFWRGKKPKYISYILYIAYTTSQTLYSPLHYSSSFPTLLHSLLFFIPYSSSSLLSFFFTFFLILFCTYISALFASPSGKLERS